MRDSLTVLKTTDRGFVYGTNIKSNKGFSYPGFHNSKGGRKFLFLTKEDFAQMIQIVIDYLKDLKSNFGGGK
jgi:hypothetical protein